MLVVPTEGYVFPYVFLVLFGIFLYWHIRKLKYKVD